MSALLLHTDLLQVVKQPRLDRPQTPRRLVSQGQEGLAPGRGSWPSRFAAVCRRSTRPCTSSRKAVAASAPRSRGAQNSARARQAAAPAWLPRAAWRRARCDQNWYFRSDRCRPRAQRGLNSRLETSSQESGAAKGSASNASAANLAASRSSSGSGVPGRRVCDKISSAGMS